VTTQGTPEQAPGAEPWTATARRTVGLALIISLAIAASRRSVQSTPIIFITAMWFTLGGHFVELFFLRIVRPRINPAIVAQFVTRVATWFVGGVVIAAEAKASWVLLTEWNAPSWPWWAGGVAFVFIEWVTHTMLRLAGRPSVFNGRG
jgi:hypothetical protein